MVDEDKNHSKKTGESKTEASSTSSWNIENRETCQCLNDQNVHFNSTQNGLWMKMVTLPAHSHIMHPFLFLASPLGQGSILHEGIGQ